MKKHRSIIYVVLRTSTEHPPVVLDSFASYEEADNKKGAYEQEFADRGVEGFTFQVFSSCYYDI